MPIATGQFTIIDYNDALTLTGFISSNNPKTQVYNPDNGAYSPDWTSTNLVLTPSLYKLGTTSDIITSSEVQSVQWYSVSSGTEALISADANHEALLEPIIAAQKSLKDTLKEYTLFDVVEKI